VETETNGRLIEEEANKRLQQSLYLELQPIICNFRRGVMTLYGVVSSFHVRQIAQELVQGLEGIEIIDNQLEVAGKKASPNSSGGVTSDDAGSTGLQEPELRRILGEGLAGPASSGAKPVRSEIRNPKSRKHPSSPY
jgi:osmotically-inducible protein OsmY